MIAVLTCFDNIAVFIAGNEPFHCLWHMFFFQVLVDVCQEVCGVSA